MPNDSEPMSDPTLGDFRVNGRADAYNSYSAIDFDFRRGVDLPRPDRARAVVLAYAREHMPVDGAAWIAEQDADAFGDASPIACYAEWRLGWLLAAFEITLNALGNTT